MRKLTFDEAFEVMVNLHRVFEEVGKSDFCHVSAENFKYLFFVELHNFKTVKEMKDHMSSRHGINQSRTEFRQLEVKVSKMMKSLELGGLIALRASHGDSRIKDIVITPQGHHLLKAFREVAKKRWDEFVNA